VIDAQHIQKLEADLRAANVRLDRAAKAFSGKHVGSEWEEFNAADENVLRLERELAVERGDAYALPLEFPYKWCTGAPLPHLIQSDDQAFLLFLLDSSDPNWDGSYVNVVGPASESVVGIVRFEHCISSKFGSPNDEVFEGHPLNGKGLRSYQAMQVANSPWIRELKQINSVHPYFDPDRWQSYRHYLFGFHDTTFECVALSFETWTEKNSASGALINVVNKHMVD
jgi:hypothetical protein